MTDFRPGQLVRSLAGRDKGKHYLVLQDFDQKHVLLVDGHVRPLDRPKKKNKAHLQRYERGADFSDFPASGRLQDSDVIRHLKTLVPAGGQEDPGEEV